MENDPGLAHEGVCKKCGMEYRVWNFDDYGTRWLCSECDELKQSLDTAYFPSFTKPIHDRESEIIEAICDEMSCDVWETDNRLYIYDQDR